MPKKPRISLGLTRTYVFVTVVALVALTWFAARDGGRARVLGATWWDALTAFGTVLAVLVALGLALYEAQRARRAEQELEGDRRERENLARIAVASLVTGVIESSYNASEDGTHYLRQSDLVLSNASTEPVFNVHLVVGKGEPPAPVGPLSAPYLIPVLPAQSTRSWDVSTGVLATANLYATIGVYPTVEVFFTDARGVRWHRHFDGDLTEAKVEKGPIFGNGPEGERQMGDLANLFNPLVTALSFLSEMTGTEKPTARQIAPYLAPNAKGWTGLTDNDLAMKAERLRTQNLAAHVWYPARQVAWMRLLPDAVVQGSYDAGKTETVEVDIMTLVFLPNIGWRVFSVGAGLEPERLPFPEGSLTADLWGSP